MELVIDTETTGLTSLSFATERNYAQWPRLVQIAWGVIAGDQVRLQRSEIIRPDGFQIPGSATKVHGITQTHAAEYGKNLADVLIELNELMKRATTLIAHNLNFDIGILQSESMRTAIPLKFPPKRQCTAFLGQKYLRREKKQRLSNFPKLSDLYMALLGNKHTDTHDAQSDMIACGKIYIEFRKIGYVT